MTTSAGRRAVIRRTYLGPGATTTPRTPAELEIEAWRYVSTVLADDPDRTVTARDLAKACTLTHSGAHAYLTTWTRAGRLTRTPGTGKPSPYDDRHTRPLAHPLAHPLGTIPEVTMPAPDPTTGQPSGRTAVARRDVLIPAALDYAARGWHVFPLRPDDKRPAFPSHPENGCAPDRPGADPRCRRAGRHVGWQERATTDPSRIRRAWQHAPYGIGIACGPSGLVVLDLDTPKPDQARPEAWDQPGIHDGTDVLAALCETAGHPLPIGDTYTVRTGRGGLHLYWQAPRSTTGSAEAAELRCTAGQLGWLIDTRAAGGYVVAPPSTAAGCRYVIDLDALVAPLPAWLATALTPRPVPAPGPVTVALRASGDRRRQAYLEAAIARAVEAVHASAPGQRNRALYGAAVQLGQLVAGGELTRDDVIAHLLPAGLAVGQSATEARKTIASGLTRGQDRPRTLTTSPAGSPLGAAA